MMKRKIITVFGAMFLLVLTLSGCVKFEMDVKVNPNNSADVNVTFLINSMVAGMASSEGGNGINLDEMKSSAEKAGYTATSQKEGNMIGYKFAKHFKNVNELSKDGTTPSNLQDLFKEGKSQANIFTIKKGLLQNTYSVDLDMDLDSIKPPNEDGNEFAGSIYKSMMSQMDFKFKSTLPIKTVSNNASKVSDDDKSLEWQLIPGQKNKIKMEFKVWNTTNIILIAVGGVILLVILLLLVFRRQKKTKELIVDSEEQNMRIPVGQTGSANLNQSDSQHEMNDINQNKQNQVD